MSNIYTFDWKTYISNYKDLQEAGIDTREKAYYHWIVYGKKEGRVYCKIYNHNQLLKQDIEIFNYIDYVDTIKDYIVQKNLQDRVFYTGQISYKLYNEITCACDIGLQIRPGNGGGISGSVIDCLSVDIPVITTKDIVDSLDIDHEMLIYFDLTKYKDWIQFEHQFDGYSDSLVTDIGNFISVFFENKKKNIFPNNNNKISEIVNKRFDNYAKELMNTLMIKKNNKIAIVTPYPPDFTGVADFTFSIVQLLFKYIDTVDIYTDADIKGNNIYKIDDIQYRYKEYNNVIYVVGNSYFHAKIIDNLKNWEVHVYCMMNAYVICMLI